jgi:hypothetical protein
MACYPGYGSLDCAIVAMNVGPKERYLRREFLTLQLVPHSTAFSHAGRITVPSALPAASLRQEIYAWIQDKASSLNHSLDSFLNAASIVIQSFAIGSTKETPVLSELVCGRHLRCSSLATGTMSSRQKCVLFTDL